MRRQTVCPGNRVCCPNPECGKPIRLLVVRNGEGFSTCTHNIQDGARRRKCGQKTYWHCTDLLCTVIAVTTEEYDQLAFSGASHIEILRALGQGVADAEGEAPAAAA
jgi:hypothetical protein